VALFALCFATRLLASRLNYVLPEMEPDYIRTALAAFDHTSDPSRLPLAYGALLYGFHAVLRHWLLSSHALYVVSATAAPILTYLLAREALPEGIATKTLILAIFLPHFTAAVVGFSHAVPAGYCFLLVTLLAFQQLCKQPNPRWWWLAAAIAGGAAVLIRSEYLLVLPVLWAIWMWRWRDAAGVARRLALSGVMALVVFGMLFAVSRVEASIDPGEPIGLLGNARYGYWTFLHTLTIRENGITDEPRAVQLGDSLFGPGEANHYSIARAIVRNPKVVLANVAFNLKELLKDAGHPLFIPAFLLPLVGAGFIGRRPRMNAEQWLIFSSVVPGTLAVLLLFHPEIRYMTPLTLPLVIMMANGLDGLEHEWPWLPRLVYAVLALLFLAYLGSQGTRHHPSRARSRVRLLVIRNTPYVSARPRQSRSDLLGSARVWRGLSLGVYPTVRAGGAGRRERLLRAWRGAS
jgi:hypothetical protein